MNETPPIRYFRERQYDHTYPAGTHITVIVEEEVDSDVINEVEAGVSSSIDYALKMHGERRQEQIENTIEYQTQYLKFALEEAAKEMSKELQNDLAVMQRCSRLDIPLPAEIQRRYSNDNVSNYRSALKNMFDRMINNTETERTEK